MAARESMNYNHCYRIQSDAQGFYDLRLIYRRARSAAALSVVSFRYHGFGDRAGTFSSTDTPPPKFSHLDSSNLDPRLKPPRGK
jgi:hypothetical protein